MWRATNADGTLTYAFIESIKATFPYYVVRLLGGALYTSGMFIMTYNMVMTIRQGAAVDAAVPGTAAASAGPLTGSTVAANAGSGS